MRIIRGKYGRRRFDVPSNISARPTTDFAKENLFNVLENLIDFEGKTALDLFAGTGAISMELLSRGCSSVTAIEKAATQYNFIRKVAQQLNCADQLNLIRGDALRYAQASGQKYDIIFADPPYDLPNFAEVPRIVLGSRMLKPGTLFVLEHSKNHDFSDLANFAEHRSYGSVNFSIFDIASDCRQESSNTGQKT